MGKTFLHRNVGPDQDPENVLFVNKVKMYHDVYMDETVVSSETHRVIK